MKNMVVLIDTNVLLNYITGREDQYSDESVQIIRLCADGQLEGVIAFHSLSTIWYILRKWPDDQRRKWLRDLCEVLTVSGASQDKVLAAIDNDGFKDFEDCLQEKCGLETNAQYIVTVNTADYKHSAIAAVNPRQLLNLIDSSN